MNVKQFKEAIRKHILNNPLVYTPEGLPIFIARHFFIKENNKTITNEERELKNKLIKLMSYFLSSDVDESVIDIFDKSFEYKDEYINIVIEKQASFLEIYLGYEDGVTTSFVRSNAFFLNEYLDSYFTSFITIDTVNEKEKKLLGTVVDFDISKGKST